MSYNIFFDPRFSTQFYFHFILLWCGYLGFWKQKEVLLIILIQRWQKEAWTELGVFHNQDMIYYEYSWDHGDQQQCLPGKSQITTDQRVSQPGHSPGVGPRHLLATDHWSETVPGVNMGRQGQSSSSWQYWYDHQLLRVNADPDHHHLQQDLQQWGQCLLQHRLLTCRNQFSSAPVWAGSATGAISSDKLVPHHQP